MNNLSSKRIFMLLFLLLVFAGSGNAQIFHRDPEKKLFSKTHRKDPKVKESKYVLRAKKKQEANDRKLKNDYDKSVKRSQKRTVEIQTPEVQERMKQNKKEYTTRDKEKTKKISPQSRRAAKKYK
jgi:hypothetical protein